MESNLEPKVTAPLRETGRIAVNFTSRIFPTPMRESQAEVEEQVGHINSSLDNVRLVRNVVYK